MKIGFCIICLFFLFNNDGFCNSLALIECVLIKDGGSRCVEYWKDGQVVKSCIDHRSLIGTNGVFIGGYPTAEPKAEIISEQEMRALYDDIVQIMNSDAYRKYSAMTRDELLSFVYKDDFVELGRAMSYRYLKAFKDDLSAHLH